MTSGDGTRIGMVMELPRHIHGDIPFVANWEKGHDPTIVYAMDVDAAVAYIDKMIRLGDFKQVDPQAPTLDDIRHIGGLTFIMARTTHGEIGYSLPGVVEHPPAEDLRILERFAGAFDIAHQRFLDLKRSEARARDVQVELALERVRSRTMAMRRSDELNDVAFILFQQLRNLGGNLWGTGFGLCTEDGQDDEFWFANEWGVVPPVRIPNTEDPAHARMKDGWMQKAELLSLDAGGEALQAHYEYLLALPAVRPFFQHFLDQGLRFPEWQQWNAAYFNHGYLLIISLDPYPEPETLKRFARVFEQAYTRFLDLQRAEAQARTAMIEAALERVRARALAMQEPEELREIAKVLRHEMGLLGVEELETSTVFIHDSGSEQAECWFAIRKGSDPEEGLVSDHISLDLPATWVGRQMDAFFNSEDVRSSILMQGPHRRAWIEYCYGLSSTLDGFYGESIPDRTYHLYKFSNGAIGAAAPGDISPESWDLLQRTASVFSLAYARFRDLTQARIDLQRLKDEKLRAEQALSELRATQALLVQSEKMASLGELTAGIAHEIKNPLNFVNNFAEVSGELFDELKAATNPDERAELIDMLQNNLDKINEHGKRADAIVRSMLQHSRSESGKKEPTDINALADEYLRLAYHGLRAKDKSFNAEFELATDPALPGIDVVPQDIGRVVLNLINNAFYAVAEKQRQGDKDYVPTVVVRTRRTDNGIELSIRDNGPGIPEAIREKIFQPFFTTKPTGQGTGLGLSLSYDIIKAHGGTLTIESSEGKGATFCIEIPFSS
jgi:signal transduction histidine kinase